MEVPWSIQPWIVLASSLGGYNRRMNSLNRLALLFVLTFPVLLLGLVAIHPFPVELVQALQMVKLAEARGRYTEAAAYLRVVLVYQPERLDLRERIGDHEFTAQNYLEAINEYEIARRGQMIGVDGLSKLAEAYLATENVEAALQVWRDMGDLPAIPVDWYPYLVAKLREHSDWDNALAVASTWRKADRRDGQAGLTYGLLLSYIDPGKALQELRSVRNLQSAKPAHAERMIEALEGLPPSPDRAYAQVIIGQRLGELGEWDLAEQSFLMAVDDEPGYAEAWAFLAIAQQNLEKDGFPALRTAAELHPASDIVRISQALFWRRQNEPQVALSYLRALAEKYPKDGSWRIEIGATLVESGDLIEAMHSYQDAIEIEPENPTYWRALAVFSATHGFDEQSFTIPAVERALELDPESVENLGMAGWVYYALGNLEKAEQFLQQALQVDGAYPPALLHIGQVYLETGRTSQAYGPLRRAATQTDDLTVAFLAQRLLANTFQGAP